MFELTYDILDDLEARECNAASQICSNSVTNIFENMTPTEWYDAARESGCNVMFTCGFLIGESPKDNIYVIGDFLNDIVYRFFGETLKVQPIYLENTIDDDIYIPEDVQKEENIDTFNFLGFRIRPFQNRVIFKIALKLDLEHPNHKTVQKVLDFLASLGSFKGYLSKSVYFAHYNGFSQIVIDTLVHIAKKNRTQPSKDEESEILKDLIRIFCCPANSKFYENVVYSGYLSWLYRHHIDITLTKSENV